MQKLDSFSETLSPATYAIHFTKDLTGKLLSKTRNRVCAVIKDGVLKGKAISSKGKIVREFNEKLDDISLKAENGEIKAIKGDETYDLLDDMPGYELKETAGYGVFSKVTTDANGKYTERIYALKGGDGASPSKFFEEIEANALAKNATDIEIIGEAIANPTFKENQSIFERWGYKFETVTENGEELIKLTKRIKSIDNISDDIEFANFAKEIKYLPGPQLPEKIASTFQNAVYVNRKLASNEKFYKYHGVNNRTGKKYAWYTNKKYSTETELRQSLAIRNDWGVQIENVTEFDVPAGIWVSEGKAASQGIGYPGGDYQAVIMNTPDSWIIKTEKAFK